MRTGDEKYVPQALTDKFLCNFLDYIGPTAAEYLKFVELRINRSVQPEPYYTELFDALTNLSIKCGK